MILYKKRGGEKMFRKPTLKGENAEIFEISEYDDYIDRLYTDILQGIDNEVLIESIEELADWTYQEGFIDGFKQALFYSGKI